MDAASRLPATPRVSIGDVVEALVSCFTTIGRERIRTAYGRQQTDYVLDALDRADVVARLDVLAGDAEFWKSEGVWKQVGWSAAEAELATLTIDLLRVEAVLGPPATARLQEGVAVLKRTFGDAGRLVEKYQKNVKMIAETLANGRAVPNAPPSRPKTLSELAETLYDQALPTVARGMIGGLLRWLAAFPVLGRAMDRGTRLEPWLALELAECTARFPEATRSMMDAGDLAWLGVVAMLSSAGDSLRVAAALKNWSALAVDGIHVPLESPDDEGR